jgi:uncharacterized membrane protein
MKLSRLDAVAIAVIAGQTLLAAYIYAFGQAGPLPVHFGITGEVNRWGDRTQVAAFAAGMAALNALIYPLLPALTRGPGESRAGRGIGYARGVLLTASALITLMLTATGLGLLSPDARPSMGRLMMGFLAVLTLAIGAFLGKVGPNPFVGVRTFWSIRSRLAWDRSNRLLGRLWFWLGLLGLLAAPVAPEPEGALVITALMLVAAAAAVVESWRVWREDPDRAAV